MTREHEELEETFGSEDITLRMALAEAEMEISLLKIELMRTKQKLERLEASVRAPMAATDQAEATGTTSAPMESGFVPRSARRTSPPSVIPPDTICTNATLRALPTAGSLEAALRAAAER